MLSWQDGQVDFKFGQGSGKIETTIILLINNQVFRIILGSKVDLDNYFGKIPSQSMLTNNLLKHFPDEKTEIRNLTIQLRAQIYMGIDNMRECI